MKTNLFAAGIIMVGISIVAFFYSMIGFQECAPVIDDIGSFPTTQISQKCEMGGLISTVGSPLFVIGLGMMIGATYQSWGKRNED